MRQRRPTLFNNPEGHDHDVGNSAVVLGEDIAGRDDTAQRFGGWPGVGVFPTLGYGSTIPHE